MKKHSRNTQGPGAWFLGGVASVLMCVSAFGQYVATQSTSISIPDSGNATPYPSKIDLTKSNILGVIQKVTVTVNNLTHPYAPDLGLLLVGPNNNAVVLMSDSGGNPAGSSALNSVTLIISDDASNPMPINAPLVSGTSYKPTDNGGLVFGAPAPGSGYSTTLTSAFKNADPNGVWSLYVLDTTPGPSGSGLTPALGVWSLNLFVTPTFAVQTNSSTIATNLHSFDSSLPDNALTTFVNQDNSVGVGLVLSSASTDPGNLTVTATGIANLVTNFTYSGSGANRTVTISPNANTYGTNTLTLTVKDPASSATATTNITLAVAHVDQVPLISLSTNTVTTVATQMTTNLIVATLGSLDPAFHPTNALNIIVKTSDSNIVSPTSVFLTPLNSFGGQQAVSVVPTGAGTGTANITLQVDNGKKTNSAAFSVTVNSLVPPLPVAAKTALISIDGSTQQATNSTLTIPANTIAGLVGNLKVSLSGLVFPRNFPGFPSTVTLTAPNNQTVTLISDTVDTGVPRSFGQVLVGDGGSTSPLPNGSNLTNTLFVAPVNVLSNLLGVNPNGTWTLSLGNPNAGPLTLLNGFTLIITVGPTVGPVSPNPVHNAEETANTVTFTVNSIDSTVTNVTGYFTNAPVLANKFTGTINGSSGTLTFTGLPVTPGTNTLQVVAVDKNGYMGTNTTLVQLTFVDHPPVIGFIPRQVVSAGQVLTVPNVTVTDVDTPISQVTLRASTDNQKLIPDGNITLTPTGLGTYTLTAFPIGTTGGSVNITLTANDHDTSGTGTTTSTSTFNVFVQPPDFPLFIFGNGITINNNAPGSPYGATNVVSGLIGSVEKVRVTLYGVATAIPANLKVLLVAPNNTSKVLLLAGAGGNLSIPAAPDTSTTLIFDDAASGSLAPGVQILSGTYKPSANGQGGVSFPAPAPAGQYGVALTDFANVPANGNWVLYVTDTGSTTKGAIVGGWSLSIQTAPSIPTIKDQYTTVNVSTNIPVVIGDNQPGANVTVTAVASVGPDPVALYPITNITVSGSTAILQINPLPYKFGTNIVTVTANDGVSTPSVNTFKMGVAFATQPPLFTLVPGNQTNKAGTLLGPLPFKVFSPQGNALNVTASSLDNPGLIPSGNITITAGASNGNTNDYTLSLIPNGTLTGTATVTIQATDNTLKSSASFKVTVTPIIGGSYTNLITIPAGPTTPGQLQQGQATPYPATVNIKGLGGLVSSVQVALVGLTHQHPEDLDILLVAPDGKTEVMLMAHAGAGSPANGLRLTFDDAAATQIPQNSALNSQSYKVGDYSGGITLPSPAAPRPYATSLAAFNGLNPNGDWSLYVLDDNFPTAGTINNGWVLYLQTAPGIASIAAQTTAENVPLPIPLNISDESTDPTNLTVTVVTSGDFPAGLVDPTNLVVTGKGGARTLTITPTTNLPSAFNYTNLSSTFTNLANPGTNVVTVTVTDPILNLSTVTKFPLKVTYVNQAPAITTATNSVDVNENGVIGTSLTIPFTVGDVDTVLTNITARSSDQGLLANSNIVVAIAGGATKIDPYKTATVNVTLTPTTNVYGTLSLSLVANDGVASTTNTVTVNIKHVWQKPTITGPVSPQPVIAGVATTNIAFTVGSVEVPSKSLFVFARSSNTSLVPNSTANIVFGGTDANRTIQLFTIAYSQVTVSSDITIFVTDLSTNGPSATNSATFTLNATAVNNVLATIDPITTSGVGTANLYPSAITASGLVGATYKVNVILPSFSHNAPANLDLLLVEEGTVDHNTNAVVLMSGAGDTTSVNNLRLQFDDAGAPLPKTALASATYAPANYTPGLIMPPPAQTNTIWTNNLGNAFAGRNPNGVWKLYVNDRGAGDTGNIPNGWQLVIQTAPTIAIPGNPVNLPITENSSAQVTLNLQDMFVDTTNMLVTASSDNQSLLPDRNVTFGKITSTGFNGTVYNGTLQATITPATLQFGTAHVTFQVARSDGATATLKLLVTVTQINVPSTISRLDDIAMPENGTSNVTFIVSDPDTPLSKLSVQATSDNGTLIPSTSIVFTNSSPATNQIFGLPANNGPQSSILTVTLKPTLFQASSANITIAVTDPLAIPNGTNLITSTFNVVVTPVVFPPFFISSPNNQSVAAGGALVGLPFQVASPVAAATTLTNAATSSDQTLIKNSNIALTQDAQGTNRTVSIVAESSSVVGGTATITLIVGDPNNGTTTTAKFNVTVRPSQVIYFANTGLINILDNSPADPYPSQITVANLVGPISKITVTLSNFTHSFASDVGVMLVSPQGKNLVLMNNLATGRPGPTNVTFTFDQSAAAAMPASVPLTAPFSYKPLDNSSGRLFSGITGPYTNSSLNAFNGASPNGTWKLYVQDFVLGDFGVISNGWSLGVTTLPVINGLVDVTNQENQASIQNFTVADDNTNAPLFSFSATSDNQTVVTNNGVVFTPNGGSGTNYTITVNPVPNVFGSANITVSMVNADGETATSKFKVTFTEVIYPPTIAAIPPQSALAGNGAVVPLVYGNPGYNQNQLTLTFASSNPALVPSANLKLSGTNLLISPAGVQLGSANITVTITNPKNVSTNTTFNFTVTPNGKPVFGSTNAIVINDNAPGTPYPSALTVSGVSGNVTNVTATLVGISHTFPSDVSVLLVGPQGQAVVLMSRAGSSFAIPGTRLTFDDTSTQVLPQFAQITDGSYQPTDYKSSDVFFTPAPPAPYSHAMSVFKGVNPNGTWSLYVQDDQTGNSGNISSGWNLSFTTDTPAAVPVVSPIASQTNFGSRLAQTIKVNFSVDPGPSGTNGLTVVASADNTNLVGSVTVAPAGNNTNFTASLVVNALKLGSAKITVFARNQAGTGTNQFTLTVNQPAAPVLAAIPPVTTPVNISTNVALVITSPNTPVASLLVTVAAVTNNIVSSVIFSAGNTVATFNVVPNRVGHDQVTIKVTDGFSSSSQAVLLTVTPVGAITMAPIPTQTTTTNIPAKVVLTITSPSTSVTNLTLTGSFTNTALTTGVTFAYNGANMVATVNLAANKSGKDYITIAATDGFSTAVQSFVLNVGGPVVNPPSTVTVTKTGNNLTLSVHGTAATLYSIQVSSDLKNWTAQGSVTTDSSGNATTTVPINPAVKTLFARAAQ